MVTSLARNMERPMMVCHTPVRFVQCPVTRADLEGEQVGAT